MRIDFPLLDARAKLYSALPATPAYLSYIRQHELDVDTILDFAGASHVLPVRQFDHGRFDFTGPGDPIDAFIIEALDVDGETTLDLVAWPLDRPHEVLSLMGRAPMVGMWAAFNPATYFMGKPLQVRRTPLEWLKSGCTGAAVVDAGLAARCFLDLPGQIAAQDRVHARQLASVARSIVPPDLIVVPGVERRAA